MSSDAWLDATAQAEFVQRGEASPRELVEAAIGRIEKLNPALNAVIHPLFDKAHAAASSKLPDGPFRGVPMLVKDGLLTTAGDPMHNGMRALKQAGWTESRDSWTATRLRRAGFVIVGKTNLPELATIITTEPLAYGATRNPWDTSRSPGGSSGGSAAAVASGMVAVAHGTDMGSVRDTAAVLDAISGPGTGDPTSKHPPRASWAIPRSGRTLPCSWLPVSLGIWTAGANVSDVRSSWMSWSP